MFLGQGVLRLIRKRVPLATVIALKFQILHIGNKKNPPFMCSIRLCNDTSLGEEGH